MFRKWQLAAVCVVVLLFQAGGAMGQDQSILGISSTFTKKIVSSIGQSSDPNSRLIAGAGISPLAKTTINVANTDWSGIAKSKVSMQQFGSGTAKGGFYMSFADNGTVTFEDEEEYFFMGTYGYDEKGKLWVHISESDIEDFFYYYLGVLEDYDFTFDVLSTKSKVTVKSGKNGPIISFSMSFAAVLSFFDPEKGDWVNLKMKYSVKGKGLQD